MTVDIDSVIKQLTTTGLLSEKKLEPFLPPHATPNGAEELLKSLIKQGLITKFQATQVIAGKARHLILGNYTLLDKIGAGGMGQVFKAKHRRMERFVALKTLPASMLRDEELVARFHREVVAAARLRHPNVVAADDADEANGIHFLVMEYIDGRDLSHCVKSDGPMSIDRAVDCVLQTARGLQYAHGEGVIHRDIKPSNLLLDKRGAVKILDMGLARIESVDDNSARVELTGTGVMMGTVDYVAPEQAVDSKKADARSDIYSLGCTLFFLLMRRSPYLGDTAMSRLLAHRDQMIPSLVELRNDVPEQLNDIFQKMIAKRPEDRHQSMTEVIAELEQLNFKPADTVAGRLRSGSVEGAPTAAHAVAGATLASVTSNDSDDSSFAATVRLQTGTAETTVTPSPPRLKRSSKRRWIISGSAVIGVSAIAILVGPYFLTSQEQQTPASSEPPRTESITGEESSGQATQPVAKEMESAVPTVVEESKVDNPDLQPWLVEMSQQSELQRLKSVIEKLKELNPGFDGKYEHRIEGGVVTFLNFVSDHLADFSPLHALKGLVSLHCVSKNAPHAKLRDLHSLSGLNLLELAIDHQKLVSDLSPLRNLPLLVLSIQGTSVKDLSPVRGLKLISLNISDTEIEDLSPLQGMPLKGLHLPRTRVRSLAVIDGMPLNNLTIGISLPFQELARLKGHKLEILEYAHGRLTDLSILESMPLIYLNVSLNSVTDLTPLRGMPLRQLNLMNTLVTDLTPLKGMPLQTLELSANWTHNATHVTNFKILSELPVKFLALQGSIDLDLAEIRAATTLEKISDLPVEQFCKRIEEARALVNRALAFRDPGFKAWEDQAAKLPAEQLVQAVKAKLIELNDGFQGELRPTIENSVVTSLEFDSRHAIDLSPLRVMNKLTWLKFISDRSGSSLDLPADLSPIEGMMPLLEGIVLSGTQVADLSPLRGTRLKTLIYERPGSRIKDLSPLKGLPLQSIVLTWTNVDDLSPLEGMPLRELSIGRSPVSDVSPLEHLPLRRLILTETAVRDYSPLYGKPISDLTISVLSHSDMEFVRSLPKLNYFNSVSGNDVLKKYEPFEPEQVPTWLRQKFVEWVKRTRGLPPVQQITEVGKKLKELNPGFDGKFEHKIENGAVTYFKANGDDIADLSPLRAFNQLQTLYCIAKNRESAKLRELAPLRGMKLSEVSIENQKLVADLLPLSRMPLRTLSIQATSVKDISPLRGTGLTSLNLSSTEIEDLTPLRGLPLESLQLTKTRVRSLEAIDAMPLTSLSIDHSIPFYELARLKGHKLRAADILPGNLVDLSVLESMPLTRLNLQGNPITDLAPLRGLPLRHLNLMDTLVTDLSPLKDMRLDTLELGSTWTQNTTHIKDLKVLSELPVKNLELLLSLDVDVAEIRAAKTLEKINGRPIDVVCKKIEDARARVSRPLAFRDPRFKVWEGQVAKLPAEEQVNAVTGKLAELNENFQKELRPKIESGVVTSLEINSRYAIDLSPLRVFNRLKSLNFQCDRSLSALDLPADLSPLEGMLPELRSIYLYGTQVTDLSPLRGMKLKALVYDRAPPGLKDLSPLKGMPLDFISLSWSNVTDLTPLEGMPLHDLHIYRCPVSDVSPLKHLPLQKLSLAETAVRDYSPLYGKPITGLAISVLADSDLKFIRSLPALKTVCGQPVAEFLKEYNHIPQKE